MLSKEEMRIHVEEWFLKQKEIDEKNIQSYMEQFKCSREEAKRDIAEIQQQAFADFYGYSKYTGKQY